MKTEFNGELKSIKLNNGQLVEPKISIICYVYNGEQYIEEQIVSVLEQSFTNFEYLILDDGSTDDTGRLIRSYLNDSRIKYVYQGNIGRNLDAFDELLKRSLRLTTAELVCFIGADDIYLPDKLEKQVDVFESNPEIDIVFSDGYHIDAKGNRLSSDFRFEECLKFNKLNLLRKLFKINFIAHPAVMMKRKSIEVMGGFETGFASDYHFWIKSALFLNFKFIDEKLFKYRIHEKGASTGKHNKVVPETVSLLLKMRSKYSILELYPEIYYCNNKQKAFYSAYLDFGNTMLTANIPVPQMAVNEYQLALEHNAEGIEALNNLAVALWLTGERDRAIQIFEQLKNIPHGNSVLEKNLDLAFLLKKDYGLADIAFCLVGQTSESSEILSIINGISRSKSYSEVTEENSEIIDRNQERNSIDNQIDNQQVNNLLVKAGTHFQPLVSVVIPCYKYAQFLPEAVKSVVNQTYQNWECIIVNDGSPDNTSEVARDLIEFYSHKNLRLLEKQNSGVVSSRNFGFKHSSGQFILFLDADDKIHSNFLEETVAVLIEDSSVGFVYTDIQMFGVKHDLVSHGDFDPERFLRSNQATVTSLFRREIYDLVGGFKKVMEIGWEDWEFWISVYEKGWQGHRLVKSYLYYRQHPSGSRQQNLSSVPSGQALQLAKIIKLHYKLYHQQEILWAEQTLLQHNRSLAMGLTELNLCPQTQSELQRIEYPPINCVSESSYRPLVSVMIPTYNPNLKYLEKTLRSVLEQELGVDEMQIEVVDDCSTQNDPETIVNEISRGRVQFYRQSRNLGIVANWNACIQRARGHWVHILHQDDLVLKGFYKCLQEASGKEPTVGAAFCRHSYIDEKDDCLVLSLLERETPGVLSDWLELIATMQRVQFPSIIVRRSTYEELGGFCPQARSAADWEMWKRIAAHYPVWYEPELLASFRLHSASESSHLIMAGTNIADIRRAIEISKSYLPKAIAPELCIKA
ncbi:MAG: glycosyltransferase, partial [Chroococcidiopsidaceae cyanobacterium CP_BM_RX_35]|nr:glycosyltransferase [Chroococcidiopsidaceae cyanobacterium CP_BM_RX_35]